MDTVEFRALNLYRLAWAPTVLQNNAIQNIYIWQVTEWQRSECEHLQSGKLFGSFGRKWKKNRSKCCPKLFFTVRSETPRSQIFFWTTEIVWTSSVATVSNVVYLGELLFTLKLSLSAMDISTCGVRKCIGGVPFSFDLNESYINNVRIEVNDKKVCSLKMSGEHWGEKNVLTTNL